MGMDVMGMNPINNEGETFHANLWSWRPIHYLCEYLSMKNNLRASNWVTVSLTTSPPKVRNCRPRKFAANRVIPVWVYTDPGDESEAPCWTVAPYQ